EPEPVPSNVPFGRRFAAPLATPISPISASASNVAPAAMRRRREASELRSHMYDPPRTMRQLSPSRLRNCQPGRLATDWKTPARGSLAGAHQDDPGSGAHAPLHLLAGVVDV